MYNLGNVLPYLPVDVRVIIKVKDGYVGDRRGGFLKDGWTLVDRLAVMLPPAAGLILGGWVIIMPFPLAGRWRRSGGRWLRHEEKTKSIFHSFILRMAHRSARKRKQVQQLQSPLPEIPTWFAWDYGIWRADELNSSYERICEEERERNKRRRKLVSQTIKTLAFQALDIIKTAIMENRTSTDLWLPDVAQQTVQKCIEGRFKFQLIDLMETLEQCYKEKA